MWFKLASATFTAHLGKMSELSNTVKVNLDASGFTVTGDVLTFNKTDSNQSRTYTLTLKSNYEIQNTVTAVVNSGNATATISGGTDGVYTLVIAATTAPTSEVKVTVNGAVYIGANTPDIPDPEEPETPVNPPSGDSEDLGNTTFGSSETPVTIISDFSGFTFENGKVVSTAGGSTCNFGIGTARAASITQVLKVSGGEAYTFTPTISGLQYALIEFTDAPCTVSTLNKSGQYGQAWSSVTSGTIHTNTKYLTINFNRGSGDFTTSELEALKNAIKLS